MKSYCIRLLVLIFLSPSFLSCDNPIEKSDQKSTYKNYIDALNQSDLTKASSYISENFILSELTFIQTNDKSDWFIQYKWDSVFQPNYKIIEIVETDSNLIVTMSKICNRIRYLHNEPTIIKSVIDFENGKISKDNTYEYKVFDFNRWQSKRDSLVLWISINHPSLDGFIYDQTIEGAQNYLKAIDLYTNK